jgi:hypothetical protein
MFSANVFLVEHDFPAKDGPVLSQSVNGYRMTCNLSAGCGMQMPIVRPLMGSLLVAALSLFAVLPIDAVCAQDWVWADREAAKTWGMHRIAVIQAEAGDVQGAKRTISQISEEAPTGAANVTVVSFWNGQPIYECMSTGSGCPSAAANSPSLENPGWGGRDSHGTQHFLARDRAADRVPSKVSSDLPSNYLDPDPRHGAIVDFTDGCDSHGTRVTLRKYADGYAVIETPQATGKEAHPQSQSPSPSP